jgi:hypothetical protein
MRLDNLHKRIFPSLDPLIEVHCQGLNELADDKEQVASMMGFAHLNVNI